LQSYVLRIGIALPQEGEQATRENIIKVSREAERAGFDSLWVHDRLIWPIHGGLPVQLQYVFDPLDF
jgi:alkanesulfonate monooxygenase SsuD/methylene tetrahydromethanopterin reductase-like flavin-dependent oxidoreductase (luciferase family)